MPAAAILLAALFLGNFYISLLYRGQPSPFNGLPGWVTEKAGLLISMCNVMLSSYAKSVKSHNRCNTWWLVLGLCSCVSSFFSVIHLFCFLLIPHWWRLISWKLVCGSNFTVDVFRMIILNFYLYTDKYSLFI